MSVNNENDDEEKLRILIFSNIDPREQNQNYFSLKADVMRAEIVAFVVPFDERVKQGSNFYNSIPIVTWEEPSGDKRRAQQYSDLYEITKAEAVIHLGWCFRMPKASSEAGIITINPMIYESLNGLRLSVYIHLLLYHRVPDGYESSTYERRERAKKSAQACL